MYVGAKDLDKEEIEVTALQRRPGEAAEQAVVGEPPQGTAQPRRCSAGEPTAEQESQVEQEQAADQVHVQPQVDAEGVLRPELFVTAPGGSRKGGGGTHILGRVTAGTDKWKRRGAPLPRGLGLLHIPPQTHSGSGELLAHPTLRRCRRQK